MMKKVTKLEDLPIYALEPLAQYLSVSDLNNCCSVSWPWHKIFNQSQFWKKHCNVKVVAYLKSHPCEVGNISTILAEDPTINVMSEWRANYVYQNQLRDNWINMRCNVEEIEFPELLTNNVVHYYNDHVFFIHDKHVDVWKIANIPIHITSITYSLPEPIYISLIHEIGFKTWEFSNDRLVLAPSNLVQVFNINKLQDECPLSFCFLYDKTEEESFTATQKLNLNSNIFQIVGNVFAVAGDTFIGISNDYLRLNIWNLSTKKKLKVEDVTMMDKNGSFLHLTSRTELDKIIVAIRSSSIYFRVYNITKLEFLPLIVQSDTFFYVDISNDYFFLINSKNETSFLTIYDFYQEKQVFREYPLQCLMFVHVLIGNTVLLQKPGRYSPKSNSVLNIFSGESYLIDSFHIDTWHKLWDNFAAVNNHDSISAIGNDNQECNMALWYFGKGHKRFFCHLGKYAGHGQSFTKLFVFYQSKVIVYSFW